MTVEVQNIVEGPPGSAGVVGPTGPTGPTGANGTNGLNGASAYEIAVVNGFVGTEAQWLSSLGSPGAELAKASVTSQQVGILTETDITGLVLPDFTVGANPVEVMMRLPAVGHTVTAITVTAKLTYANNTIVDVGAQASYKTKAANDYGLIVVVHEFPAGTGLLSGIKGRIVSSAGTSQGFLNPTGGTERRSIQAIVR